MRILCAVGLHRPVVTETVDLAPDILIPEAGIFQVSSMIGSPYRYWMRWECARNCGTYWTGQGGRTVKWNTK